MRYWKLSKDEAGTVLESADADQSGLVNYEEFITPKGLKALQTTIENKSNIKDTGSLKFRTADTDESEELDETEIKAMYPEASEEILGEWIKLLDFDEDGLFSVSESRSPIFEGGMDFLLTDTDKS
jgi:hypothetical protein